MSHRRALIVVGDRFTADIVERLRGEARPIVLAGATQPGRGMFDETVRLKPEPSQTAGVVPLEVFTEPADLLRWIGAALDAIAQAIAMATDDAHRHRFVLAGVPYWPLVGRTVWLHILAWIPALRHLHALTARAARAHPDGQVLTSSDVTAYNRVLIDAARASGVASTGIQHGMTGEPNGHSVVHVDTLATWGDQAERWYRDHAPQRAQFVVTGNPRFDGLAARALASPRPPAFFTVAICTGFTSDFSTGASEYENLSMIDTVLDWARSQPGVRVIHKMHPGEEPEYYANAARALGWDPLKLTTIREPILHDVLEQSDILVAAYSSTVLESLVLGTPAIVFDGIVQRKLLHDGPMPLPGVPGITVAYSPSELRQHLDARRVAPPPDRAALRSSPQLRQFLSDLDGGSTARVAALLA